MSACLEIAYKIAKQKGWKKNQVTNGKLNECLSEWMTIVDFVKSDSWFSTKSISFLNTKFQDLIQSKNKPPHGTSRKNSAYQQTNFQAGRDNPNTDQP
jgi:hypothetical protein